MDEKAKRKGSLAHKKCVLQQGVTLLELMCTLCILALLVTLALPSLESTLRKNWLQSGISQVTTGLSYARSAAIMRGTQIVFCHSRSHKSCDGTWRDGQIVQDAQGQVLYVFSALPPSESLHWNSSGTQNDRIIWLPTGYTDGQRGTFYYCAPHQDLNHSGKIVLLDTGRFYTSTMDADDYAKWCAKTVS